MAALLPLALGGCAQERPASQGLSGTVTVAGSSTLRPVVEEVTRQWVEQVEPGVTVDLTSAGTAAGLDRLCAGAADVALASRPITAEEAAACERAGIEPVPVPLGRDAVTLVVPQRNDHVRCLTVAEAGEVLGAPSSGTPVATWSQLRADWPDTALVVYGPGPASGTSSLVASALLDGVEQRPDVATSEDDQVVVQGVAASPGGFGYVPLTYAVAAADLVRPVALDSGDGCVEPSARTVADDSYPLSRPLQAYVAAAAHAERPAVAALVEVLVEQAGAVARELGGVPPSAEQEQEAAAALDTLGDRAG